MWSLCSVYMISADVNCPKNWVNMQCLQHVIGCQYAVFMLSVDANCPTNGVNMQFISTAWAFIPDIPVMLQQ